MLLTQSNIPEDQKPQISASTTNKQPTKQTQRQSQCLFPLNKVTDIKLWTRHFRLLSAMSLHLSPTFRRNVLASFNFRFPPYIITISHFISRLIHLIIQILDVKIYVV